MILIILIIAVTIISLIVINRLLDTYITDSPYSILLFLLPVILALVLLSCGQKIGTYCHYNYETIKNISSTKLVELKNDKGFYDNQFFDTRLEKGEKYYYYLIETKHGYSYKKIEANKCHIVIDNENPRIETISYKFKNKALYLITLDTKKEYVIYCPLDSANNNY